MHQFSGIWVPLVTPFTPSGDIDIATLRLLVADLHQASVTGLVVFGTTGEPAMLGDDEKKLVLECVCREASLPIIVGASAITADKVREQLSLLSGLPIAGALVTAPYYMRPSQQGIVQFFHDIAAATPLPIVVYDIPYRTGVQMELETLRQIARIPSVRAVKDCGGDVRKTRALIADGELSVLSGDDHMIFSTIAQGGAGAIAASAHLHPRLFVAMYRALKENDLETARAIHHSLAPLIESLYAEPNPAPLKSVLANRVGGTPLVRRPLLPTSTDATERALREYDAVAASLQARGVQV